MTRASLSHLYFENVGLSKAPLKWLVCAACMHAGLFCIPTGAHKPSEYGIMFREGNAGIEVELIPEASESASEQSAPPVDTSEKTLPPSPEPDAIVAESEYAVPVKPPPPAAPRSSHSKKNHGSDRVFAAPSSGSAIAQPAAQVYTTQPPYPPEARELGIEGVVRLQVLIGIDGSPRAVKVVRPSGRSDFDSASVSTVQREWRFRPARTAAGTPVESTIVVEIRFTLKS